MTGRFITFEGIEGCGKSTQVKLLAQKLGELGHDVHLAREPGGTPAAEAIRSILLDPGQDGLSPEAELLLYGAARADHVRRVLQPALAGGKVVLCDRFSDSTLAYQGAGRALSNRLLTTVDGIARGDCSPELTLLLDMPAELSLTRARERNAETGEDLSEGRFEAEAVDFHRRVRSGFLRLAGAEPSRILVLDASGSVADVHARVLRAVGARLPELLESRR